MPEAIDKTTLEELRRRLRRVRAFIARQESPQLSDIDTLLSVAEGEIDRTLTVQTRRES